MGTFRLDVPIEVKKLIYGHRCKKKLDCLKEKIPVLGEPDQELHRPALELRAQERGPGAGGVRRQRGCQHPAAAREPHPEKQLPLCALAEPKVG